MEDKKGIGLPNKKSSSPIDGAEVGDSFKKLEKEAWSTVEYHIVEWVLLGICGLRLAIMFMVNSNAVIIYPLI